MSLLAVSYSSEAGAPGGDGQTPSTLRSAEVRSIRASNSAANPIAASIAPALRLDKTPGAEATGEDETAPFNITPVYSEPSQPAEPAAPAAPLAISTGRPITSTGPIHDVNLTFYDCANQGFCGPMYNGEWVYEGAAACSWNMAIGTAFQIEGDPTQRIYVCKDRGLLADTWVDIFWYHPDDGYFWQSFVGRYGTINILYVP